MERSGSWRTCSSAAWATSSARTLARRLRRRRRLELGYTRAQALADRTAALRQALLSHWELSDLLGAHCRSFGEGLAAVKLLGCIDERELLVFEEANDHGNWAKHSCPPSACAPLRRLPPALSAAALEVFWASWIQVEVVSFGCAELRFSLAVERAELEVRRKQLWWRRPASVRFSEAVSALEYCELFDTGVEQDGGFPEEAWASSSFGASG